MQEENLSVPCLVFGFWDSPSSNQPSGGPSEWGLHTTPGGGPERPWLRLGLKCHFCFSCPGGAGPLLTTVVHSDIRGLGTGLPWLRRGAASRYVLEFGLGALSLRVGRGFSDRGRALHSRKLYKLVV